MTEFDSIGRKLTASPRKTIRLASSILILGMLAGVAYWFLDSAVTSFALGEGSFRQQAFSPAADELWERLLLLAFCILLAGIAIVLLEQRKRAELAATRAGRLLFNALDSMSEGIALYDAQDRLLICNEHYKCLFPKCRDLAVRGARFEDLVRAAAYRGQFREAEEDAEKWIEERLSAHRNYSRNIEQALRDGRWILTSDYRTSDGGTVTLRSDITERKVLERELIEVVNREQMRIARDLHDGVGQALSAATLYLGGMAEQLRKENGELANKLKEISTLISESVCSIREFAQILLPVELGAGELNQALEQLAASTERLFGVECRFLCDCTDPVYDARLSNHLYRLIQEAVTNAARHADANAIEIWCKKSDGRLMLAVTDDGVGIEQQRGDNDGLGMRIMQYRASLINGTFQIIRQPRGGTRVTCTCPLPQRQQAADRERDFAAATPREFRKTAEHAEISP